VTQGASLARFEGQAGVRLGISENALVGLCESHWGAEGGDGRKLIPTVPSGSALKGIGGISIKVSRRFEPWR
jgi:hypothetical protein